MKQNLGEYAITEKQFESQIKDLAKIYGWRYYHTWRSIHSPAGFPDCVLVRVKIDEDGTPDARVIFAELKSEKGEVSSEQNEWLHILKDVNIYQYGVQVYLWRPRDFEKIAEVLR